MTTFFILMIRYDLISVLPDRLELIAALYYILVKSLEFIAAFFLVFSHLIVFIE